MSDAEHENLRRRKEQRSELQHVAAQMACLELRSATRDSGVIAKLDFFRVSDDEVATTMRSYRDDVSSREPFAKLRGPPPTDQEDCDLIEEKAYELARKKHKAPWWLVPFLNHRDYTGLVASSTGWGVSESWMPLECFVVILAVQQPHSAHFIRCKLRHDGG